MIRNHWFPDWLLPVELDEKPEVDILGLGLSPPHLPVLVVPHVDRHRFWKGAIACKGSATSDHMEPPKTCIRLKFTVSRHPHVNEVHLRGMVWIGSRRHGKRKSWRRVQSTNLTVSKTTTLHLKSHTQLHFNALWSVWKVRGKLTLKHAQVELLSRGAVQFVFSAKLGILSQPKVICRSWCTEGERWCSESETAKQNTMYASQIPRFADCQFVSL